MRRFACYDKLSIMARDACDSLQPKLPCERALGLGVYPVCEQGGDVLELVREIRRDRFAGGARHSVGGLEAESLGEDGGEGPEGAEE